MDVVSGGELFRALRAGTDPKKIVYAGVGKTAREIAEALRAGILMFNVESLEELEQIDRIAGEPRPARAGRAAREPGDRPADAQVHRHRASRRASSASRPGASSRPTARRCALGHLDVVGIHCHIGSQITQVGPFREAVEKIADLVRQVRALGADLRYVDIGGGLGISYNQEEPPEPKQLLGRDPAGARGARARPIITEPGRVIVGNAGALLTRVIYRKDTSAKSFLVVDAGMNDLIRPSLYGSYHRIVPLREDRRRAPRRWTSSGRSASPATSSPRTASCPPCRRGSASPSSRPAPTASRCPRTTTPGPRAAEVLVRGGAYAVIRERETYEDLVRGEAGAPAPLAFRAPAAR